MQDAECRSEKWIAIGESRVPNGERGMAIGESQGTCEREGTEVDAMGRKGASRGDEQ